MNFGINFQKNFIKNALSKIKFDNAFNKMKTSNIIHKTMLQKNVRLSNEYNCNIYLKREDLQTVRSFKIRGAYHKIMNSMETHKENENLPIVTVSAGNHAQRVSLTCNSLNLKHHIFLPENTPLQKINRIKYFGQDNLTLHLHGHNFDESLVAANSFCEQNKSIFVHPFDDYDVIIGQGTVAAEIYEEIKPDIIISPIGGGGLISGVGLYSKYLNKDCMILGVEPENADSMKQSIANNEITTVSNLDTFVDGASVKTAGKNTFEICKEVVDNIFTVSNNKLSYHMIDIYQNDGIILEPAGALSISCLDMIDKEKIEGKNVVCILSGGNNDISRYPVIMEKSLFYQDLKHYFIISFGQRPGELKRFINNILGKNDDITRFEYLKKNNKDFGAVLIGIELQDSKDIHNIIKKMDDIGFEYTKIKENDLLHTYLI
jgi:threonine dehydratase